MSINYLIENPFTYFEGDVLKGIEIDIIHAYVVWLKDKKKMNVLVQQQGFTDFDAFYLATKTAKKNTIGLGSVTAMPARKLEMDFSVPYVKNVAYLVTNGHAPDIKTNTSDEIITVLGSMSALTVTNTTLNRFILELRNNYMQDLKISYKTEDARILDEIARNVLCFGYVDAISFWLYLKTNPKKFVKAQKILTRNKEDLGFAMPKGSPHKALLNEFLSAYKKTPAYRLVLEKYLGTFMGKSMAVN